MEENTVVIEATEAAEIESPATEEADPVVDEIYAMPNADSNNTDELLGKVLMGLGTVAIGAITAYGVKHKDELRQRHATKIKERNEKKAAKAAKRIAKANETLAKYPQIEVVVETEED